MKILGINSSPRGTQSQTLKLVEAVLDGSHQRGTDSEVADICKLDIQYCRACGACYAKGTCIQKDDFPDLFNKMLNADGIVIGSPVYLNNISAQLKAVFDRSQMRFTARCFPISMAAP